MAIVITTFWMISILSIMWIKRRNKYPLVVRHSITVMEGMITCSSFTILAATPSTTSNCHDNAMWMAFEMSATVLIKMYDEYKYLNGKDSTL